MTKKEIIKNQIITDIKFWLNDYGKLKDATDLDDSVFEGLADDAADIMAKVKNYLTMGDE